MNHIEIEQLRSRACEEVHEAEQALLAARTLAAEGRYQHALDELSRVERLLARMQNGQPMRVPRDEELAGDTL